MGVPHRGPSLSPPRRSAARPDPNSQRPPPTELELLLSERETREARGADVTALSEKIVALKRRLRAGPELVADDVLSGRYTLLDRLGSGGFATVWRAWDRRRRCFVALKVLHGQHSRDESRVERFVRGARAMCRLQHEHIVQVLEPEAVDDGHRYFVMELLEGGDLGARLKRCPMSVDVVLDLVEAIAGALAVAHAAGVVHRDVKPENILLTKADLPKLSDFDLVKAADTTGGTRTGAGVGTVVYAAPESLTDASRAKAPADVYGLAMTVAAGILGRVPPLELKFLPASLVASLDGVPEPVREVLEAALSVTPEGRPQDAGAFAEQLADARLRAGFAAPQRPPLSGAAGVAHVLHEDRLAHTLPEAPSESWADRTGEDPYGRWAEVDIEGVTLRMRWCPPGTFLMGSPEDDDEAHDNERPQHEVTLTEGYWMAETPCTQALWQAVTGTNPSAFKGANRPVEQVSWDNVVAFIEQANARVAGLDLYLPTEAQWEYACRAGTQTPRYGKLEDVAWFDGNSGGETHPVREKAPNAWGLYDTLGNVWEWCSDGGWGDSDAYENGPVTDSEAPRGERPSRVFRGGSWDGRAGYCRAAYRFALRRAGVVDDLGFRVARGRAQGQAKPAEPAPATPAGPRGTSETEPRGAAQEQEGSIVRLPIDPRTSLASQANLPDSLLRPPPGRPPWASEFDEDKFGWFAGVTVRTQGRAADFRMRWCPPGTFLMGSPEDDLEADTDEEPQHLVTLTEGFWIGETPCTQALWQVVTGSNPSKFKGELRPVERVSWNEVQRFLRRLNEQVPGLAASLPTEAQWECACRAGTTTARYGELADVAWFGSNSGGGTRPVGQKGPNAWGLYDTLGNVWEWCHDFYGAYDAGRASDSAGPRWGSTRVLRGGCWGNSADFVRAASRHAIDPSLRNSVSGFRLSRGHSAPSK